MRKRLFGVLAVVITVSVLLTLLLFTRENEIGLSGTELHSGGIPLETTGDSDLLDVTLLNSGVPFDSLELKFRIKSSYGVAFGTDMYTDGELTESDLPGVVIEKYDGSEWQFYRNGKYDVRIEGWDINFADPGSDDEEIITFTGDEPGLYRVTLSFREITEKKYRDWEPLLTTAPDLHSVSFTLEVPDTGKPYNLCSAKLIKLDKNGTDAVVYVDLRVSDDKLKFPLYLSKSSIELYENNGGRLQKIGTLSDGKIMSTVTRVQDCPDDEYYYVCEHWDTFMRYGGFALYDLDYDKDYALKMTFFENEDGTGERYSLVLNLVFDE